LTSDDRKMCDIELEPDTIRRILNGNKLFEILRLSVELDIYTRLTSPLTIRRLSQSLALDERFLTYLLDTLRPIGLVERLDDDEASHTYQSTPVARQYLSRESPFYLGQERFQDGETGKLLERYVKEGPSDEVITEDYWTPEIIKKLEGAALLGGVQSTVKHVNLTGRKRLLDIGGGHGLYSIFFTRKYPDLRACVLDLPQIIDVTNENIARLEAGARVKATAGDYHSFEPTSEFDAVFLSNVTPSQDELRLLLTRSHGFLSDRGIVILRSFVSDSTPDVWSAVSTLERYARRGRPGLARNDLTAALRDTEFVDVTDVHAAEGVVIVCGTK
jgi:precorrin-6B methylase 2